MNYTIRPISDQSVFDGAQVSSPFSAGWYDTLELLLRELKHLRASEVFLELDVLPSMIRVDGHLKGRMAPASPCVRLVFESRHGPLSYATNQFSNWRDNVRAIALGLEALRRVDRYGVTKRGEQYAGWKALPAGTGATALGGMTRDQATEFLHEVAGVGGQFTDLKIPWKKARANAHPDRNGGARSLWDQVEQAARVLGLSE